MKNAVFLQSWYSQITDNWYGWLKGELEKKGYKAHFIDFPEMRKDAPDMGTVLSQIESLNIINSETTIIGHSLGCLLSMRLAEKYSFKKVILVSGWDFDDLTEGHKSFWKNKLNHGAIKNNVKERFVIHSDNDPYFTQITAQDMAQRLDAEFVLIPGGGHITAKDGFTALPQILPLL